MPIPRLLGAFAIAIGGVMFIYGCLTAPLYGIAGGLLLLFGVNMEIACILLEIRETLQRPGQ